MNWSFGATDADRLRALPIMNRSFRAMDAKWPWNFDRSQIDHFDLRVLIALGL